MSPSPDPTTDVAATPDGTSDTSRRLGYLLKRAQHGLRLRMDGALAEVDMTAPQYAVLAALADEPGLSNADLARRSFVTPQTMIRIVSGLEARAMLSRRARSGNARALDATLTPTGREVLARAHRAVAEVERAMVAGLAPDDVGALTDVLDLVSGNLEAGGRAPRG